MPEHLKALAVILALASVVFAFARQPTCALAMTPEDFARRRTLWFAVTLIAFLAHNFWVYIVVAAVLLFVIRRKESNPVALVFFLLFAIPPLTAPISGLGVINYFFDISPDRLLLLVILVPSAFALMKAPSTVRFGRTTPDKLLLGYLALFFILQLTHDSFTNTLRSAFYTFIEVFVPYFVASRSLTDIQKFRDTVMAFVLASMLLAAMAIFEAGWHWLLFSSLPNALGVPHSLLGGYLERGEALRAQVTTGQPIPLGYVIAVAIGMYMFLRKSIPNRAWWLGLALLGAGLIATFSRGPWIGLVVIVVVLIATGPRALVGFARMGAVALVGVFLLLTTPAGKKAIDYLPFVGTIDEGNVTYRQLLLDVSLGVIKDNPFFGSYDFMLYLEQLRQGQGIIDIVNTYIGVALSTGLVGLTLFVTFFLSIATGLYKALRQCPDKYGERHLLGQSLIATLIGILVIIFTVSSISFIPIVYWSVAGLGVACIRLLLREAAPDTQTVRAPKQSPIGLTVMAGLQRNPGTRAEPSKIVA